MKRSIEEDEERIEEMQRLIKHFASNKTQELRAMLARLDRELAAARARLREVERKIAARKGR